LLHFNNEVLILQDGLVRLSEKNGIAATGAAGEHKFEEMVDGSEEKAA
jgi:hypothetical protein